MDSGACGSFDCLQIEVATFAPTGEDDFQERFDFVSNFLLDRIGRFFFCSFPAASGTGRRWQIFSLTSKRARLSC